MILSFFIIPDNAEISTERTSKRAELRSIILEIKDTLWLFEWTLYTLLIS